MATKILKQPYNHTSSWKDSPPSSQRLSFVQHTRDGPSFGDSTHLNNVYSDETGLYIAGLQLPFIIHIDQSGIWQYGRIPAGSHNARPYDGGILLNDTESNRVSLVGKNGGQLKSLPVSGYKDSELTNSYLPNDHARQGFCRGLCILNEGEYIAAGSSPSTISVYSMHNEQMIRHINLTMDVRNAIHGLEVWPFS